VVLSSLIQTAKLCVRNEYQLILRIHLHLSLVTYHIGFVNLLIPITRNFDVLDEEAGLAQRGTFIIDPDGVVQAAEIL
jgi:peroxiredoxin